MRDRRSARCRGTSSNEFCPELDEVNTNYRESTDLISLWENWPPAWYLGRINARGLHGKWWTKLGGLSYFRGKRASRLWKDSSSIHYYSILYTIGSTLQMQTHLISYAAPELVSYLLALLLSNALSVDSRIPLFNLRALFRFLDSLDTVPSYRRSVSHLCCQAQNPKRLTQANDTCSD